MSDFFKYFPTTEYANSGIMRDITRRLTLSSTNNLLPFTMDDGVRPDVLSDQYYDTPENDWLIYYANEITDPYEFPSLDNSSFNDMIAEKYGSVETATMRIKHWRSNWRDLADSTITANTFDNLPTVVKSLFNPVRDFRGNITGYTRKRDDLIRSTSQILTISIASYIFAAGDLVQLKTGSTVNATGEVASVDGLTLTVKDIVGSSTGTSLANRVTGESIPITEIIYSQKVIQDDEIAYYEPVSFYEWEVERNEAKRHIKLVSKSQAPSLIDQLKEMFD